LYASALWLSLLVAIINAYVAACNIALKSFSRAKLTDLMEDRAGEGWTQRFNDRRQHLILATGAIRSILNLVILLLVLAYFETRFPDWQPWLLYLVAFLAAVLVVSIFGVAVPTFWALYQAEPLIAWTLPALYVIVAVFTPVTWLLSLFDPVVRRISGAEASNGDHELGEEVMSVVEQHDEQGRMDETQKEMLEAVFEFKATTAGEIMTPRTDVVGIEKHSTLEQIRDIILSEGYSRYPVFDDTLDNIVGVLYAKDLLRYVKSDGGEAGDAFEMSKVVRQALLVPESKPLDQLLAEFKYEKVHIAVLLDEYGGTAGIVTIEDIVEEIVGEIADEYDEQQVEAEIRRINETTAEVDARVYVDDLNDELDLELPEDGDYDTVGGFVFSSLGHIPSAGEIVEYGNVRVTVMDVERTKINKLRVQIIEESEADSGAA